MKDRIINVLHDLEKQHDIKILLAVNQGSRCFGYASAESDWDVRFIYIHRPEWYFSIVKTDDVINVMMEEEHLDIEGFDLKKALSLLSKTNPTESDWLHVGDYYIIDHDFRQQMLSFESQCYNTHHALHHFYSISVNHNLRYLQKHITLKRFIYYMRGLLSCRWVEQKGCHPPVNVDELIDATITDNAEMRDKAHALLEAKRTNKANDVMPVDAGLYEYMVGLQRYYESLLPQLADTKPTADIAEMSKYLMTVVMRSWKAEE